VPVPEVLHVLVSGDDARPGLIIEFRAGTPLSTVLDGGLSPAEAGSLGTEVGRIAARIGNVEFPRPGFFTDGVLDVPEQPPWSEQLVPFAQACMQSAPTARLDTETRRRWVQMCSSHASALLEVDAQAALVHADMNPKNLLVSRTGTGWRVDAVLDWEFTFSGCAYADAANMARFGHDHPDGYLEGFVKGFAHGRFDTSPLPENWEYLGRVFDMFALCDLVTRPEGHLIADQAAQVIRRWSVEGVPRRLCSAGHDRT
jgi:Ser/Thr protein kinase RdoA (MazF antagonist)